MQHRTDQVFPHFHAVLLCDDFGEGLWPLAREQSPAFFAPAAPDSADSLLSAAVKRLKPYMPALHIVTTAALEEPVYGELVTRAGLESDEFELLVLPEKRGSAFSVALACARIRHLDPSAVVAVAPADQRVEEDERWGHLLYHAYQLALRDRIVMLGVQQEHKCHDYAYLRKARPFENIDNAFEVRSFVPDALPAPAKRALADGAFWYAGIFFSRAAVALGALSNARQSASNQHEQDYQRIAEAASFLAQLEPDDWRNEDARKLVGFLPEVSYEQAALENSSRLLLVTTTIGFSATSSLEDLDFLGQQDARGNSLSANVVALDSKQTTVCGQVSDRSIIAVGLEDTMVVDTPDALLITPKKQLRKMDVVLSALQDANLPQLKCATRRPFAWGSAALLAASATHAVWQLEMNAGTSLDAFSIPGSYEVFDGAQQHAVREQYAVASGDVLIKSRDQKAKAVLMDAGDAFEVDADDPLSIMCVQEAPAILILTAVVG